MARDCALSTAAGSGSRWTAFLSFMRRRRRRARLSSAAAEVDWESVATLSTKMYVSQPRPQIQGSTRANLLAQHRGGQAIQAGRPSQRARPAYANHPAPSGLAIVRKGSTAAHCVRPRAYEILYSPAYPGSCSRTLNSRSGGRTSAREGRDGGRVLPFSRARSSSR